MAVVGRAGSRGAVWQEAVCKGIVQHCCLARGLVVWQHWLMSLCSALSSCFSKQLARTGRPGLDDLCDVVFQHCIAQLLFHAPGLAALSGCVASAATA